MMEFDVHPTVPPRFFREYVRDATIAPSYFNEAQKSTSFGRGQRHLALPEKRC